MKRVFTLACLLWAAAASGQEQLQHQKKMYQAPDGKLYFNKALPIYLWMSNSPDPNSEKARLQSVESKAYTNPMYFDTEGYNTLRSPSKVDTVTRKTVQPVSDIIYEIYSDSEAPLPKAKLTNAKVYTSNSTTYTSGNIEMQISAVDIHSGLDKIFFSKNGAAFSPYTDILTIQEEQAHTIKYYAVDNVGNASASQEYRVTIDKTAPVTNLMLKGDSIPNVVSGRSSIAFKATDAGSGVKSIYYKMNEGAFVRYSAPVQLINTKEAEYKLTYYAEDNVGNKESEHVYDLFVDRTPPMVIDELQGNTYLVNGKEYASGRTKMKLTAIDNKAGVKGIFYSTDGIKYDEYTQPFYLPNKTGGQGIVYYAADNVNNKSTASAQGQKNRIMYMDLSGPMLNYSFIGATFRNRDTVFISGKTKISLKAPDAESGANKIMYSENAGAEQLYSAPFSVEKDGRYRITYTGYDMVQNTNTSDFGFIVDTQGPDIYERYSVEPVSQKNSVLVYPSHVVVFLSATDMDAGFAQLTYSVNGAPMKLYSGYISGFARNTKYEISIKSYDKLNNMKERKISFETAD